MSRCTWAYHGLALGALGAVLLTGCGAGAGDRASADRSSTSITVSDAVVAALSTDAPAGMYFTIENHGTVPDTLVSISTKVAERAELHREAVHGSSMMMAPVSDVPVPAGGTLRFSPGGYHVMLTHLRRPLAPGDTVLATLELRRAGRVPVRAEVVSYAELGRRERREEKGERR